MNNNSDLRKETSARIVNFLPQLSNIHARYDDFEEKNNFIIKLGELADYIDNLFESYDISSLNEILGGELPKKDSVDLPLFVYIDLFIAVNQFFLNESQGYAYKVEVNKNAKIVKEKLEKLKKKVSNLSCSEKFNKNYNLSEEAGMIIVGAQGFFTINFEKKEEKDYLVIESSRVGFLPKDDSREVYDHIYKQKNYFFIF